MKYKTTTVALIALIMIAQPVMGAFTLDTVCTDGVYYERLWNESGLTFNNTFTCANGCANNGLECDTPAQPESFFAFAIAFSLAAFTLAYIGLRLSDEYKPLQFMFLGFSVLYIAFTAYIVSGFATLMLNDLNAIMIQSYILGVFTVLGVVFYFMYLLVVKVLGLIKIRKSSGRPFKL